jgi:hypothetical protein
LSENIGPVMRRLQEENGELRSRLAELEPRLAALAPYERARLDQRALSDPTEALIRWFERLLGKK